MLIAIIGLLLFQSCNESHSSLNYSAVAINHTVANEIKLPLDSLTPPFGNYFQILYEDTLRFVMLNDFNKSLYMYDFYGERLLKKISLKYEYGNLPQLNAFYYLNSDSILLFPEYGDFYFFCNQEGDVYPNKIRFVDENDQDKIESHWIKNSAPLVNMGANIYINNVFGWIAREDDPDKYLLIEHNIRSGNSTFFIKHPPSVYDKNFGSSTFRHLYFTLKEPETILYSFAFDPYVYEYKGNKNDIISYYCAPEGVNLPDDLKKGVSNEDRWLHFQTRFSFSNIVFDPYRKIVLRVALQPHRIEDIKAGIVNPESPKKPKLFLFDAASYKILGEINLDKDTDYYFSNLFISRDGLWIQKILDNEDFMSFQLINYNNL
jgi:hypothetical protein